MGSWSVSCSISNIAIASGQECVILPLKKVKHSDTYLPYLPATLPIFGVYDDYGGIEEIEKNDNTAFIEEHFGITIEEFCQFLVDGKNTYNREEAQSVAEKLKANGTYEECKDWYFSWIDRKVYNHMIVNYDKYHKGYMDYGTPEMLTRFGFELVEDAEIKNYDPKRFNQLWRKGNVELYSDGRTLLTTSSTKTKAGKKVRKDTYLYHFGHDDDTSIETYFDVPEEYQYLKEKSQAEAWRLYTKNRKSDFKWILGGRYEDDYSDMEELLEKLRAHHLIAENAEVIVKKEKPLPIDKKYFKNMETFGDRLVELVNVRGNLHCMSGMFHPHQLYLTPQCGEYQQHQKLLERFAEINKGYVEEYGYEDNED